MLCHAGDPVFSYRQFIDDSFFVALVPNTKEWISLEGSSDLVDWSTVASVATTNNATIIHDPDARSFPQRFYRLRRAGSALDDAKAQWISQWHADYRFRLQHVMPIELGPPYVFTGTVVISSGRKVVVDAEADGQALNQPDLGTFPSVEELFAILQEAYSSGCSRVAVIQDAKSGCPTWCSVERVGPVWKRADQYRITELTLDNSGQLTSSLHRTPGLRVGFEAALARTSFPSLPSVTSRGVYGFTGSAALALPD